MSSVFGWTVKMAEGWLPTFLLVMFTIFLVLSVLGRQPKNFPPGMVILPVVGSLFSMPFGPSAEIMRGMRKKYGDVASFAIFNTRVVILSGVNLIKKVYNLNCTADHADMIFSTARNRVMTDGRATEIGITGNNGQAWREQRDFFIHHMRELSCGRNSSEAVIVKEIAELMDHLAEEEGRPLEMKRVFSRSVLNIVWMMVMCGRYPYDHVKFNNMLETFSTTTDFNIISPLHHIPYLFKVIEYIPIERTGMRVTRKLIRFIKEDLEEFLANEDLRSSDSFTSRYLKEIEKKENPNFNMDNFGSVLFEVFVSALDAVPATLTTAVYLLTKHPCVQRRVQKELDGVVGRDCLPSLHDMERLPYAQATINEVQRVFNMGKFSLPHKTNQDCKLAGYDIPKGTWLFINLDDAFRSFEHWKNPRVFDPNNFLDENGNFKSNEAFMPFGIGKRRCPSESMSRIQLFLFFTHLFHRFTFTMVEEKHPIRESDPLFNGPPLFTASLKCRSK